MRLIVSSCPAKEANPIASALLERRLAASVNIVPGVVTHVRYKGEARVQDEALLLIRTREELVYKVAEALEKLCSFDIPEVACFEVREFNASYANWLRSATEPEAPDQTLDGADEDEREWSRE